MTARQEIRFLLNGDDVRLDGVRSSDTLLDFLRIQRRLTGTKEGCAEGDCGACTVLVGSIKDDALHYEPINACIRFVASLDGCHVVSIEHLRGPDGGLHPVQQAMVDLHGSQCGFCTPGIVMALYALWMQTPNPTERQVETALQGNLCRCTGYEPIVKAAMAAASYGSPATDRLNEERATTLARLKDLKDGHRVEIKQDDDHFILPRDVDDLAAALVEYPRATIVAGATDVGLWITKFLRTITPAIFVGHLHELKTIESDEETIRIGAGVSYTDFETILSDAFPHLIEFWDRIAGWQVRNMGTIGGNIANGSPIGDTPPALIALGSEIILREGDARRALPLEDFFIEYGKQDRTPGEFVESIHVPRVAKNSLHAAYKISKRRDEDISAVCVAFNIVVKDEIVTAARIAFGGMAGTPARASHAETALIGKSWSEATCIAAAAELDKDFTPLTDWRASSAYRMLVAKNLFRRLWLENNEASEPVRLPSFEMKAVKHG